MSSIYEVFGNKQQPFDKQEWAAKKQTERQEAYDLIDLISSKIIQGDHKALENYLGTQGRFDRYSVANALLISAQMPDATELRDYNAWQQNRIRLNRGARKVSILEPGKEYTRQDGSTAVSYNAKSLYDISQTTARNQRRPNDQPSMRELVSALIDASPVPFQPAADLQMNAIYNRDTKVIKIKTGLSETDLFRSMAKEVAAAIFVEIGEDPTTIHYKQDGIGAMLGSRYGLEIEPSKIAKLSEYYKGFDAKELRQELNAMRNVLGEIQLGMYKSLERNKPAKVKEQER